MHIIELSPESLRVTVQQLYIGTIATSIKYTSAIQHMYICAMYTFIIMPVMITSFLLVSVFGAG